MKKRVLSIFLCFMICLSFVPASAFAEGEHVHDSECGYVEAVAGSPCTHECGEDCSPCTHEHDAECGYTAAVEGAPCTYVEPKEETPEVDEAVAEVQAKVDDLPAVETVASMSTEQKTELSEKLDALCDDYYDGLSEAQQAQITGFDKVGELYDALGAYGTNATNEYVERHIIFELNESDKTAIIRGYDSNDPPGKIQYNDDYADLNVGQYTVTAIGEGAMFSCNALYEVQIKEVVTVAEAAFAECVHLEKVSLPKAKAIGSKAFDSCTALRNIELPLAKTIGANAFIYCKTLENIELPEAETIGEYAFNHCDSLKEVSLPKAKTIESIVFDGCYSLEKIELPSATQINSNAFRGVKNCALTLPNNWNPNDAPVKQSDGTYSFRGGSFTSVSYTHDHKWSAEWSHNETAHWHECTAEGCDITDYSTCGEEGAAYGTHSYNATYTCICGAKKPVDYVYYENGEKKNGICTEYEIVTGSTTVWGLNKWYVVSDNVTIAGHVDVFFAANLILCDGARLEVTDIGGAYSGTLNIYGQEKDSGTLIADGTGNEASIKGTDITINGGTVIATAGYKGAGIGCADSNVTINGGNVTATSNQGAGIGGNYDTGSGTITINGGNITATSIWGAGIGGGSHRGSATTITINGGNVTATSSYAGGIGHGRIGTGIKSLDNGTLTLGSGVTFGAGYSADHITRSSENRDHADEALGWEYFKTPYPPSHTHVWSAEWSHNETAHWHACTAEDCDITDYSSCGEEGSAYGTHSYNNKYTCVCGAKKPVDYVYYENGEKKNGICADYEIISAGTTQFEDGKWYVFPGLAKKGENGSSYPGGTVTVNGTSNLILIDGKELYLGYYGLVVPENSTLNIYGQSGNTGKLTVHGAIDAAGIGGSSGSSCGTVNIHGGDITAEGNYYGAGIGGGRYGNGGNITIYGGSVTAKGAYNSAGIGGGYGGDGGNVTIYGGTVKATGSLTGSSGGPGIGGSQGKDQGTLILGTDVTFGAGENADNITEWKNLENARTMNYFQSPFTAPAHTHSFSFSASQNKAIATCANTDGACQLDEDGKHTVTLTLTANNSTYTGSAYNGASTDDAAAKFTETTGASLGDIQYFNDGTALTAAPVNSGSYTAKVTVTKGEASATAEAAFTIAKAAATITTNPTAAAITYGQALSASALTGGTASVPGSFAWDNGSTVPAVADSGVTAYNVKFTPTDASNYMEATVQITLTVKKADYTDAVKTASGTLSAKSGKTVEITLPAVPTGAAYGEVTNGNTDFFTVSTIANGKVTVTSAKDWDSQTETADKTFTVAVTPDANHNGYNITVTVKPAFHNHSWSGEWAHNETGHWHACTAADCNITDYSACGESGAAYAVHSFNGNTCSVCGYVKSNVYTIIEGANSEWTKGSTSGMLIASDAPFSKFTGVKVDGNAVAGSNYTAVEGSTRVTFKPAYLETLSVGKHAVDIVSSDGTASTEFMIKSSVVPPVHYTVYFNMRGHGQQVASQTVEAGGKAVRPSDPRASGWTFAGWYADADCTVGFNFNTPINADTVIYAKWIPYNPLSPNTGDTANLILWASLLAGSAIGIAGAGIVMKKKKH